MAEAKRRSAEQIKRAKILYIRPQHLLCILCRQDKETPLVEDNLIELLKRIQEEPDIPVTLVEGCCMVCDPCNEYRPGQNLCLHTHMKDSLRDLMILERLGLKPGATMPAGKLYECLYERIGSLKEICGWGDGSDTAPYWAPCRYDTTYLDDARRAGLITGRPVAAIRSFSTPLSRSSGERSGWGMR